MRIARIALVPLSRVKKRPLRLVLTGLGVALAIAAFTLARYLAESGEEELEKAIAESLGKPATVLVSLSGVRPSDERTVESMVTVAGDVTGIEPTVVYLTQSAAGSCPGRSEIGGLGVVDGPLLPLVVGLDQPAASMDAGHGSIPAGVDTFGVSTIGLGTFEDDVRLCLPGPIDLPITSYGHGPWRGLGLDERLILLQGQADVVVDTRRRADRVDIYVVVERDDAAKVIGRLNSALGALDRVWPNGPDTTVRRADDADQFIGAQRSLSLVLTMMAVLGLVAGVIGVITTQMAALPLRLRQLALYRALGASNRDTLLIVFIESSVIILIGALSGVLLTVLALTLAGSTITSIVGVDVRLSSVAPIIEALGAVIPCMLVSGLVPAVRARRDLLRAAREL